MQMCDVILIIGLLIRASVDALCRDGTDEILRDPRRKRLNPRRESLAKPLKLPSNCCLAHLSYRSAQQVHTYCQFSTRENGQTRFHEFRVIIIIIILLVQTRYLLTGTNRSALNVSTEDGGVHGHPAFVFYMLYVTTAFRRALPVKRLTTTCACALPYA